MNLPEKYTESMKMMLGDEYDSYIESFNDKRLYGLRVNNLKISTEDFLKICPFKLEPVLTFPTASLWRVRSALTGDDLYKPSARNASLSRWFGTAWNDALLFVPDDF